MPRKIKKSKKTNFLATTVVEKIQSRSMAASASKLSLKEINAEITSVRKARKAVKAILKLKGKLNWEGDLNSMRKNRA